MDLVEEAPDARRRTGFVTKPFQLSIAADGRVPRSYGGENGQFEAAMRSREVSKRPDGNLVASTARYLDEPTRRGWPRGGLPGAGAANPLHVLIDGCRQT